MQNFALHIARFFYAIARLRWPRSLAEYRLKKLANNPKTFGQHLLFKMAFERNALRAQVSDKLIAKEYAASKIGSEYIPKVFASAKNANDLFNNQLPTECVFKVNHGSGGIIIRSEFVSTNEILPNVTKYMGWKRFKVHPDKFDQEKAKLHLDYWLRLNYAYWPGRLPEWTYENINRRCFVEELIIDEHGRLPNDYRFYTFNGETKIIGVDSYDEFGNKSVKHFYPDWRPIDARLKAGRKWLTESQKLPNRPRNLDAMLEISSKLGAEFDWIRVDLYSVSNKIYFGELTNFPTAGQGKYSPSFLDTYLGKFFK